MKKKAYISPETEVTKIKIEQLLTTISSGEDGVHGNSNDEDESDDDNRSRRRRRDVWDEEEDW